MNVYLMHPRGDFVSAAPIPRHHRILIEDLGLETLFHAMSGGDEFLLEVSRRAILLGPTNDVRTIKYRQAALQDCLRNREDVRRLYALAIQTLEQRKKYWFGISRRYLSGTLYTGCSLMRMLVEMLGAFAYLARSAAPRFQSEGFRQLFASFDRELGDEYLSQLRAILNDLTSDKGTLVSASLGDANELSHCILRKATKDRRFWLKQFLGKGPAGFTYRVADRDESGARALSDLRNRALAPVTHTIALAVENVLHFVEVLRTEVGFYIASVNLHDRLQGIGERIVFPSIEPVGSERLVFTDLYDACMALRLKRCVVGNALSLEKKNVVLVTGANQGGKSTFLRSIGVAQLMMQAGLFVGATFFLASAVPAVFTHFRRDEDPKMIHGKLDEELARLSDIVNNLKKHSMVLLNESFAATNEREGSYIAEQITRALADEGITVVFVTHLYAFARLWYESEEARVVFLRAQRQADGTRTFRMKSGEPLPSSNGADLYQKVFGSEGSQEAPRDELLADTTSQAGWRSD
jgi:hypothetical protein